MIDSVWPSLTTMFGIGLLGAGHCVGMCGGIISALSLATNPVPIRSENSAPGDKVSVDDRLASGNSAVIPAVVSTAPSESPKPAHLILAYSAGRIFSYACVGAIVASLGYFGARYLALAPWLRGIAGLLLIAMGLYMAGWWRGMNWLEKGGQKLWKYIQPLSKGLLPVKSVRSAVLLGLVWGWLPCGLVYAALAFAATASSPVMGMVYMAAFGFGTLPAVLVGGFSMGRYGRLLQSKNFRTVFALSLIGYGMWTLMPIMSIQNHH